MKSFHHDHFGICQEYTWGQYGTVRSRSRAKNETFTVIIKNSVFKKLDTHVQPIIININDKKRP